jgi:outer membrane biosynthesis protein TonB
MMKTFFATTALVGILFVSQPDRAAGEPIPDVVFSYIAKSKLLVKYRTQIDTYQELIDEHISDMQKTPTAAEMKLLNSYVQKDTTATLNYKNALSEMTAEDATYVQAEKEYYEQTAAPVESLIPVAPPLPSKKPTEAAAEEELKELNEPKTTAQSVEKEVKSEFTAEEVKKLKEDKVQPKDVKKDIRSDLSAFEQALAAQKSKLTDIQKTVNDAKSSKAFKADSTAETESGSLVDSLTKAINARRDLMNMINDESEEDAWEDEIEEDWEKGVTPS